MLCKITANQTEDGVRESIIFVDGHCVRHAVRVRHELCVVIYTRVPQFCKNLLHQVSLRFVPSFAQDVFWRIL